MVMQNRNKQKEHGDAKQTQAKVRL
jgi:hypothetical protein